MANFLILIIASIIKIIEKGIPIGFSEEMIPQNIEKKLFYLFCLNQITKILPNL